jgi:hypothetical protein
MEDEEIRAYVSRTNTLDERLFVVQAHGAMHCRDR